MRKIMYRISPFILIFFLLIIWQTVCSVGAVSQFILPSPLSIIKALIADWKVLFSAAQTTLLETGLGILISIILSYFSAFIMDKFKLFERAYSPIVTLTQTIPTVAIAPLLVLWMGFGIAPKVVLVVVVCYFPITVSLLKGFKESGKKYKLLEKVFGLSKRVIFWQIKVKGSLKYLFVGLKIALSYAIVSAVVAEWLGGDSGLGVYMMRVRKNYSYDKMFAVIFLITILSLLLLFFVSILEKICLRWETATSSRQFKQLRHYKKIKNSFIVIVIIILSLTGWNIFTKNNLESKQNQNLEKVTLILDWTPNTNHSGIYLALNKGYYQESGIDLEIQQPPEDGATPLVGSGKSDFGIDYQDYLGSALAQGTPVTAVGTITQNNTSCLISLKEKNITRPRDLEGKRLAWDGYDMSKAEISYMVKKDGGDPNKIIWVDFMTENIVASLKMDNIDVVSGVYWGWEGIQAELAGLQVNSINFKDYNAGLNVYSPIFIVNNQFLANKKSLAKKFMQVTKRGYQEAAKNPTEAVDSLLKYAPELDGELTRKSQEYLSEQYLDKNGNWGLFDNKRWDFVYSYLYSEKLLPKKIESNSSMTNSLLEEGVRIKSHTFLNP
ncbi:MAG: ABC transporter permease/substrate-binding protein [Candidatus Ancillula sp.]|jgi:ABC-type nitrate/sulfonate/bicarbonate transport system permease component/ABC-type nitrate/sulfonate/bicarbonate transport system substrate-binding protein|nr:ABC transporter permease/substrate-binding protein [Candidatus Ancillula sp.]